MGKVCRKRQTKQVLQNFFTTGNIKQLRCNLHLAEQQGAQISMVYGTAPAVQIAEYARVSGMAKIVMAASIISQEPITGKTARQTN